MAGQYASEQTHPAPQPDLEAVYTHLSRYPFSTDTEYQAGLSTILGHQDTPATPDELREKSDLVLQAQCFYFSLKFKVSPSVAPQAYSAWLQSQPQPQPHPHVQLFQPHPQPEPSPSAPPSSSTPSSPPRDASQVAAPASTTAATANTTAAAPAGAAEDPPYPTSFAAIVDLITRNIPVPGIEEIPPTVLEPGSSKIDRTPRRKKPWEKDAEETPTGEQQSQAEGTPLEPGDSQATSKNEQNDEAGSGLDGVDVNGHKTTGEGVVKILQPNAIPDSGLLGRD